MRTKLRQASNVNPAAGMQAAQPPAGSKAAARAAPPASPARSSKSAADWQAVAPAPAAEKKRRRKKGKGVSGFTAGVCCAFMLQELQWAYAAPEDHASWLCHGVLLVS